MTDSSAPRGPTEFSIKNDTHLPTPTKRESRQARDASLLSGLAWTSGAKWAAQGITWVLTIFIARRLTPSDYGVFGMALLYLEIVQLISDGGFGMAIVQRRELDDHDRAQLGGAAALLSVLLLLITLALAPLVSLIFREPRLTAVLGVLSLTFLGTGLQVLPRASVQRALDFKRIAMLDLTNSLVGAVATFIFAVMGMGYWALVYGAVTRVTVTAGVALTWRDSMPRWPRNLPRLRGALTFGGHFVLARIAWWGYSNADFAIIGRRLGTAALGTYTLGWTLSSMAVDKIAAVMSQVVGPVFASVQHDATELRRYFLGLSEALALATFPFSFGLAWIANDLVAVLLGPKWSAAALPLRILAAYMGLRSLTILVSQLMFATGHGEYGWKYNGAALLILPPLFFIGSFWGTAGVAAGWVVGYPVVAWLFYRLIFRIVDATWREYLRALGPAIIGCVVMVACLCISRVLITTTMEPRVRLVIEILVGATAYFAALILLARERLRVLYSFAMRLRDR